MINKNIIFAALILLALGVGYVAFRNETTFRDSFWSELFWLISAVVLTTFVLETILQQDQDVRRRDEDAFAFRSFTATMVNMLLEMSEDSAFGEDELIESAIQGNKQFYAYATKIMQRLSTISNINIDVYEKYRLDISGGLRDLSRNYIRLFASNRKEMAQTYKDIQELASLWTYRDELSTGFQKYTQSLQPHDSEKSERESKTEQQLRDVKEVIRKTANYLLELIQKTSENRGMPPPP